MVNTRKVFASLILLSIIIYGVLKIWILRMYSEGVKFMLKLFDIDLEGILNLLRDQAKTVGHEEQPIGWLIYYPSYFLLHIAFIHVLFLDNVKIRNYLKVGLTAVIGFLVMLWIIFSLLDMHHLSHTVRIQFRKLFGLPFILLAIEGGRIIYSDLIRLSKK